MLCPQLIWLLCTLLWKRSFPWNIFISWLFFHIGNCSCPPQACLFLSSLWLLAPFSVSWLLGFRLHALLDSLIQLRPTFHDFWVCTFLSGLSSRFHMSPSVPHRPLHFHIPECTSPPSACLISVNDVTRCPGQGPQNGHDPCFLYSPFSVNHQNLMVAPHKYISFHCPPLLLTYLMPLSPIAIKMVYQ